MNQLVRVGTTKEGKAIYADQGFQDRVKDNSDYMMTLLLANARKIGEQNREDKRLAAEVTYRNPDYPKRLD